MILVVVSSCYLTYRFSNLEDLLHRSRAYLPAKIAVLLDANPSLIAPAVTTFCQRDIIDKRICRKNEHFPPDDKVLRLVTFTKFLYAMISHEKFKPERNNWNFPPPSDPRYKEYQLGYKIVSIRFFSREHSIRWLCEWIQCHSLIICRLAVLKF